MSMNQPNPSQTWIWEPTTMGYTHHHQHYYFHRGQPQPGIINSPGREHMFEKPLTPSDVGKLNRLVIPKQHAEKHFPLGGGGGSGEKGLLLDFEDGSGKRWRFRYSYWASSQSYVLTKGWSRFVKEKKLDAGDVVLFQRYRPTGRGDDTFYIGFRRRATADDAAESTAAPTSVHTAAACRTKTAAAAKMSRSPYATTPYLYMNSVNGGEQAGVATRSTKRLRLFGVNLECVPELPGLLLQLPQQLDAPGSWSRFMATNAASTSSQSLLDRDLECM